MSRAGRKRKPGYREPSGQLKRPTVQQLAELERAARDIEKVVVLAQPHRRGNSDQRRSSPLGCFVIDHKLRDELYDAGNEYAALVRRLWAAKGVPVDQRGSAAGMGLGPSDATVRGWERDEEGIRTILMRLSTQTYLNIRLITVEERGIKPEFYGEVVKGLRAIAIELGMMRAHERPYA
jgi:hypothetical protein